MLKQYSEAKLKINVIIESITSKAVARRDTQKGLSPSLQSFLLLFFLASSVLSAVINDISSILIFYSCCLFTVVLKPGSVAV